MRDTSTVAILFTDIVDSTGMWERHGQAMSHALTLHDQLTGAAFADALTTRHTGDGAMAVFASVDLALEAAEAAATAIDAADWPTEEPVRIRLGLHLGPAERRGDNWFGNAVNRASRITDAAGDGQLLVSSAFDLAARELLPDYDSAPVGEVLLKGIEGTERLHHPLRPAFGEPRSPRAAARPDRLPRRSGTLFGRSRDIEMVRGLLDDHRLVTLSGVGGVGKTQLALAVAEAQPHPAFFVDLGPSGPDGVLDAFASAVGLPATQAPSRQAIVAALSGPPSLALVDNCEHVLDEITDLLEALLDAAPGLRVLATSREALGLPEERVSRVRSLATDDAITLFMERARARGVEPDDAGAVAEICTRLDGIPLAVELAAARVGHLPVADIAAHLDDRFRLLGGGRGGSERQRTLDSVMAWSYDLLDDDDRHALQAASTFIGGFDLDAFAAVAGLETLDAIDRLGSLGDKSLVSLADGRYEALETVRLYGLKQATEQESAAGLRQAHADHFRDRLGPLDDWDLHRSAKAWEGLWVAIDDEPDGQNLLAALEWFDECDDPASVAILAAGVVLQSHHLPRSEPGRWYGRDDLTESLEGEPRGLYLLASAVAANIRGDWVGQWRLGKESLEFLTDPRPRALATALWVQMMRRFEPDEDPEPVVDAAVRALGDQAPDLVDLTRARLLDRVLAFGDVASCIDELEMLAARGEFVARVDLPKAYLILGRREEAAEAAEPIGHLDPWGGIFPDLVQVHVLASVDRPGAIHRLLDAAKKLPLRYDWTVEAELLVGAAALALAAGEAAHASFLLSSVAGVARSPGGLGLLGATQRRARDLLSDEEVESARRRAESVDRHEVFAAEVERLAAEIA